MSEYGSDYDSEFECAMEIDYDNEVKVEEKAEQKAEQKAEIDPTKFDISVFYYVHEKDGIEKSKCVMGSDKYNPSNTGIYREIMKNGKARYLVGSRKNIENYMENLFMPNISVYIPVDVPRKICLDIDIPSVECDDITDTHGDILAGIKDAMKFIYKIEIENNEIWTWNRHRENKYSYRIILPYILRNKSEQDFLFDQIYLFSMLDPDLNWIDHWSTTIQMPYCYKDQNCLKWDEDLNDDSANPKFEDYDISNLKFFGKFGEELMLPQKAPKKVNENKSQPINLDKTKFETITEKVKDFELGEFNEYGFAQMIRMAPSFCEIHSREHTKVDGWIKICSDGTVLQGCYANSAKGEKSCKIIYKNPELIEEKYCFNNWHNFCKDYPEVELNEIYKFARDSIINISNGGNSILITKNKKINTETGLEEYYYEHVKESALLKSLNVNVRILNPITKAGEDGKDPEKYIYENLAKAIAFILKDRTNKIKCHNDIIFRPYGINEAKPKIGDSFNIFSGFAIQNYKPKEIINFTETKTFKHWSERLFGGLESWDYVKKYIAHRIQFPNKRPDVAIVICSSQGVGKDSMREFLQRMIGYDYCLTYNNVDNVFSRFNLEQRGKLLTFMNELGDKGTAYKQHEQLKGLLTKDTIRVEPKGYETYTVNHCSGYFMFTNNPDSLFIESGDRRFFMTKAMEDGIVNNHEYFKWIHKEKENVNVLYSAFKYFSEIDLTDFVIRDIPNTEYKIEQKLECLSLPAKFMLEVSEDSEELLGFPPEAGEYKISVACLYNKFVEWKIKDGYGGNHSKISFGKQLKKVGIENTKRKIEKRDVCCYVFNPENIKKTIHKALGIP